LEGEVMFAFSALKGSYLESAGLRHNVTRSDTPLSFGFGFIDQYTQARRFVPIIPCCDHSLDLTR